MLYMLFRIKRPPYFHMARDRLSESLLLAVYWKQALVTFNWQMISHYKSAQGQQNNCTCKKTTVVFPHVRGAMCLEYHAPCPHCSTFHDAALWTREHIMTVAIVPPRRNAIHLQGFRLFVKRPFQLVAQGQHVFTDTFPLNLPFVACSFPALQDMVNRLQSHPLLLNISV